MSTFDQIVLLSIVATFTAGGLVLILLTIGFSVHRWYHEMDERIEAERSRPAMPRDPRGPKK